MFLQEYDLRCVKNKLNFYYKRLESDKSGSTRGYRNKKK